MVGVVPDHRGTDPDGNRRHAVTVALIVVLVVAVAFLVVVTRDLISIRRRQR
jgi:hypothetical protein